MIYLDNAATSLAKPQPVIDAVSAALTSLGNAGRGAGSGALDASRAIERCREQLASLLGCPRADHVAFASGATEALNAAINGIVRPGDRVVTTVLEHNSVLRPLNRLAAEQGVEVVHADCDALGRLDFDDLERRLAPGARALVLTHASNVTGNVVDIARAARMAHAVGALVIADVSQTAGSLPIDMSAMMLDVACFAGHKGLLGPQGTGGLAVAEGVDIRPWNVGGTGAHSFDELQPSAWPTRLEAGTLNGHGIAGLSAALAFIEDHGGAAAFGLHEAKLARRLYEGVRELPGATVYGDWPAFDGVAGAGANGGATAALATVGAASAAPDAPAPPFPLRPGIVALNIAGIDSATVSDALMEGWGIATRPGAHCAPLMHRALGTESRGIVRLSVGWNTTDEDVDTAVEALAAIAEAAA